MRLRGGSKRESVCLGGLVVAIALISVLALTELLIGVSSRVRGRAIIITTSALGSFHLFGFFKRNRHYQCSYPRGGYNSIFFSLADIDPDFTPYTSTLDCPDLRNVGIFDRTDRCSRVSEKCDALQPSPERISATLCCSFLSFCCLRSPYHHSQSLVHIDSFISPELSLYPQPQTRETYPHSDFLQIRGLSCQPLRCRQDISPVQSKTGPNVASLNYICHPGGVELPSSCYRLVKLADMGGEFYPDDGIRVCTE